jgi:2-C-methyl-D-erythritol 4-phosphate cytidylyltransferase
MTRARRVALVPCAGSGSRSGADRPKQYVEVAGRPVVQWTLQALLDCSAIDAVAVVVSPGDGGFEEAVPAGLRQHIDVLRCGGPTRADTVLQGLAALRHGTEPSDLDSSTTSRRSVQAAWAHGLLDGDWVLVHDAARCLIEPASIQALIDACEHDPVGGLLAHPVADTLKRADAQGRVQSTVPREAMWAAQTPQMFRAGLLERSLRGAMQAGVPVTDEASAVEWAGAQPRLVACAVDNFKLTYAADFERAARILQARAAGVSHGKGN